jgi:hypothetical protein
MIVGLMFRVAVELARRLAVIERRLVSLQRAGRVFDYGHSQLPLLLLMKQLERFAIRIYAMKRGVLEVMNQLIKDPNTLLGYRLLIISKALLWF